MICSADKLFLADNTLQRLRHEKVKSPDRCCSNQVSSTQAEKRLRMFWIECDKLDTRILTHGDSFIFQAIDFLADIINDDRKEKYVNQYRAEGNSHCH